MKARQFFNSIICEINDFIFTRNKAVNYLISWIWEALNPQFLRVPFRSLFSGKRICIKLIYIYVFFCFFCLILQGYWAFIDGRFFPDSDPVTKNFLEDHVNIVNYTIVVELYGIIGFLFLNSAFSLKKEFAQNLKALDPNFKGFDSSGPKGSGFLSVMGIFAIGMVGSTLHVQNIFVYTSDFWFMEQFKPTIRLSSLGFYYIFLNMLLFIFVLVIAFTHFEVLRVGRKISQYLKRKMNCSKDELERLLGNDGLNKALVPFAKTIMFSKILIFLFFLNMVSWRINESNVGLPFQLIVLALVFFGIWFFSLPRYSVQLHIFKMKKKTGIDSYEDIRPSWILGFSSLIDVFLFSYVLTFLIGDSLTKIVQAFL